MRRLCRLARAVRLYVCTKLSWSSAWRLAGSARRYQVVARDGLLYVEPR